MANKESIESGSGEVCGVCKTAELGDYVFCDEDQTWYHKQCLKIDDATYDQLMKTPGNYVCPKCVEKNKTPDQVPLQQHVEQMASLAEVTENTPPSPEGQATLPLSHDVASEQIVSQNIPTTAEDIVPQAGPSGKQPRSERFVRQTSRKSTTPIRDVQPRRPRRVLSDDSSSEDEEGYSRVRRILNHRGKVPKREFLIQWYDKSESWEPEKNCDGCVNLLNAYCNLKRVERSKLKQKGKAGYSGEGPLIRDNWATVQDVLERASRYGNKNAIQPEEFTKRGKEDAIYVMQMGEHCFVILYYVDKKLALIADGDNLYEQDEVAQEVMRAEFHGIQVKSIPFVGQNRSSRCASSAVGIIIEFQSAHMKGEIPVLLKPSRVNFERINNSLHKVESEKVTPWIPIHLQAKGVTCPKCGKNYRYARNRNVLNKHKCDL